MGTVRGQDLAHMFFPAAVCPGACGDAQKSPPALLMLAGDSPTAKKALLLQYAYNAALRGVQSQPPLLCSPRRALAKRRAFARRIAMPTRCSTISMCSWPTATHNHL